MSVFSFWQRSSASLQKGITAAPIQNGSADHAVLAFGLLYVVGWLPNEIQNARMQISTGGFKSENLNVALVRYPRPDVTEALARTSLAAPYRSGFVTAIPLSAEHRILVSHSIDSKFEVSIVIEGISSVRWSFRCSVVSLAHALTAQLLNGDALRHMSSHWSSKSGVEQKLLEHFAKPAGAIERIQAHIDNAFMCDRGPLVIAGWVEDASIGELYALNPELTDEPRALKACFSARKDVSLHLKGKRQESQQSTTDLHGFVAVAGNWPKEELAICRVGQQKISMSERLSISRNSVGKAEFFGRLVQYASEVSEPLLDVMRRLLYGIDKSALVEHPKVARVLEFGAEAQTAIEVSIVIPFYGDSYFLLDHLVAQKVAPENVEWILVCDDPSIAPRMIELLKQREKSLKQKTRLVILEANVGFAQANNVALTLAEGRYILAMNSDVYCESFDFLDAATARLETNQNTGCIGFSLQFEDGTIQHDGMTLERASFMQNLWVCEHKGKGMPQSWQGQAFVQVDGVTGALLLMRKSDISNGVMFDPTFLVGDFEDADLCMRIRATSKEIELLRVPGLYHLERQSLRFVGDGSARSALTFVNCLTFNDRWSEFLDQRASSDQCAS
jgi:GT2 family glycosyltransferase